MILRKPINTLLLLGLFTAGNALAKDTVIAIIDSGTDMKHELIAPHSFVNEGEITDNSVDDDHNGYVDDIFGWNFAGNNNQVIDYSYIGSFPPDNKKFFELQQKMILGTISTEELAWMKRKLKDPFFLKQLQTFANFVHGTHVTGISLKNNNNSKVLAIKLIPTEIKLPGQGGNNLESQLTEEFGDFKNEPLEFRMKLLQFALTKLAEQQMNLITNIAVYANFHHVDIANGSFGTGFKQSEMITGILFRILFFRAPTEGESFEVASFFLNKIIENGQRMVQKAPHTLFIFAAGNDGTDNDKFPTSPANIGASNTLSVAATLSRSTLASFSNFGTTTVDVAAPGVNILSSIPDNDYMSVSGTSQAAPFVTGVCAGIKEINPHLKPFQIKKIVMETVDTKAFLEGKIVSGGIVNEQRALRASLLSRTYDLSEAIQISKNEVGTIQEDLIDKSFQGSHPETKQFILPLPSEFRLN